MSARYAGCSAFRQCIAAFKDLILPCWFRRRRQRTASPSQVFFFLSPSSFSLFFPSSQREGRKCRGKKSVPICSFLPLPSSSLSSSERVLPQNQESHSLISICAESLLGGEKYRDISPPLFVEHSGVSLCQSGSRHYHPILFQQAKTSLPAV